MTHDVLKPSICTPRPPAAAPLDEALVDVVLDLSGRPYLGYDLAFRTENIGRFEVQLVEHFFQSLANTSGMTLHIRQVRERGVVCERGFGGCSRVPRISCCACSWSPGSWRGAAAMLSSFLLLLSFSSSTARSLPSPLAACWTELAPHSGGGLQGVRASAAASM